MSTTDHHADRLQRARTILSSPLADAAPALALELAAGDMPLDAALATLDKATASPLTDTAKQIGLA